MVEELVCLMGSPYLSSFPTIVWTGYACSGARSSAYRRHDILRFKTRGQGPLRWREVSLASPYQWQGVELVEGFDGQALAWCIWSSLAIL